MTGPVLRSDRVDSLDVLRGVAVLGILIMNIQSFSMYSSVYVNPSYHGKLDGAGYWVWYFSHVLAEQKFMNIFSLLFGAGILLFAARKEDRGLPPAGYHYRRMGWLILFGLLHAYFLWDGDVLFWYGMCGLIVYLFRRLRPSRLIVLGLVFIAVGAGIAMFFGWSMPYWGEERLLDMKAQSWRPPAEKLEEMLAAMTGSYGAQVAYRAPHVMFFQTFVLLFFAVWRVVGLMLMGMGLYKLGVLSALRSRKFYALMPVIAMLGGIPLILAGVEQNFAHNWDITYSFFKGSQFNYWGSLLVSGGWIGLVMLVCKAENLTGFTRPLAATGRMAFSNYIGQTVICTMIFYGHGLGYYNQVDRVGQILIVAAVWVLQLTVSPVWLSRFRFGPLEWLWRSLTYRQRQPFRI